MASQSTVDLLGQLLASRKARVDDQIDEAEPEIFEDILVFVFFVI